MPDGILTLIGAHIGSFYGSGDAGVLNYAQLERHGPIYRRAMKRLKD